VPESCGIIPLLPRSGLRAGGVELSVQEAFVFPLAQIHQCHSQHLQATDQRWIFSLEKIIKNVSSGFNLHQTFPERISGTLMLKSCNDDGNVVPSEMLVTAIKVGHNVLIIKILSAFFLGDSC
jgi:hypothetical protein